MAIPGSGAISLNDFHVEAGGSSGTQCSINDSDIRGLIGKSSGAQMSFSEWYGASATVTSFSVTSGFSHGIYAGPRGQNRYGFTTGYNGVSSLGTSTPPTGSVSVSGAVLAIGTLAALHARSFNPAGSQVKFVLTINGSDSNSGFTSMTISRSTHSHTLNRTSATYSYASSQRTWTWTEFTLNNNAITGSSSASGFSCIVLSANTTGTGTNSSSNAASISFVT